MPRIAYLFIMIIAGGFAGTQFSINALLGQQIGVFETSLVSFIVGTLSLGLVVLVFGKGNLTLVTKVPKWQLIGGLLGAFVVASTIICVPNIGVASVMVGFIVGQLSITILVDHFGWFNVPVIRINVYRIFGVFFMLIGIFCMFRP